MTGKQYHELIEQATTFKNALTSALSIVNPIMFGPEGHPLLILVIDEVKDIDRNFTKGEIAKHTLESFYKAVLLLHSCLILFSDFTNKDNTFKEEASKIHLIIINEIRGLEREVIKNGHDHFKDKDKYLNIWKKLLKSIVYLCYEYSSNRDASQNNNISNSNKNFLLKPIHFPKIPLSWLKKLLFTRISFKWQTGSAAENGNHNQPQSPPPENSPGVSLEMIHMAIIMSVVFIGLILALTVIR